MYVKARDIMESENFQKLKILGIIHATNIKKLSILNSGAEEKRSIKFDIEYYTSNKEFDWYNEPIVNDDTSYKKFRATSLTVHEVGDNDNSEKIAETILKEFDSISMDEKDFILKYLVSVYSFPFIDIWDKLIDMTVIFCEKQNLFYKSSSYNWNHCMAHSSMDQCYYKFHEKGML